MQNQNNPTNEQVGANTASKTESAHKERLTLKIKEAAQLLGVSSASVRRLIQRGQLKPLRHLRHVLIPVHQLRELIEGCVSMEQKLNKRSGAKAAREKTSARMRNLMADAVSTTSQETLPFVPVVPPIKVAAAQPVAG